MKTAPEIETQEESKRIKVFDFMGFTIFAGQNAEANESLVTNHKRDHEACTWLHVSGRKGPSVILCLGTRGEEAPLIVLRYAAGRALKLAGLKNGQVVFAPLIDVYKPQHSSPGIFRTWRTGTIEL